MTTIILPADVSLDYLSHADNGLAGYLPPEERGGISVVNPEKSIDHETSDPVVVFARGGYINLTRTYYLNTLGDGSPTFSSEKVNAHMDRKYPGIERRIVDEEIEKNQGLLPKAISSS